MNVNQKNVINKHWREINETVEQTLASFLADWGKNQVINSAETEGISRTTPAATRSQYLVDLIKTKDRGWKALISYLRANDHNGLADELEASASETMKMSSPADCNNQQLMELIQKRLKNYYISEYSIVGTMFGCHKHVDEIWVPLKIDEKSGNPRQRDSYNHLSLLERLNDTKSNNVAVVKGHPGMGKTTLVKKIAFDWANGKFNQLKLVLTVPLRHVGKTTDFRQLAADYFEKQLELSSGEKSELLNQLKQLDRGLLICLDGLDEYSSWSESPFKDLFGNAFKEETNYRQSCPPPTPYKLLITSRPYAAEIINLDFFPLRFEIAPLNEDHLNDLVKLYCETENGVQKVNQYLHNNDRLVIKVPLILTFICYLAEVEDEIPTNLTLLYKRLVSNLIKRALQAGRLNLEIESWESSIVVQLTAKLAFDGCKAQKWEFLQTDQNVTSDVFACGFLLQKIDLREDEIKAEFPHRSIQEFFAAFHCYKLILTPSNSERNSVMKEILEKVSQFGRFFFGICSDAKRFEEMLDWLNPTFDDAAMISYNSFDPVQLLHSLSTSISDCSEAETKLLSLKLAASLEQLETKITTPRNLTRKEKIFFSSDLSFLNNSFQSGLNVSFLDEKRNPSWSLTHADKPKWSHLTCVNGALPVNLQENFDKIQILMWKWRRVDLTGMISSFDQLLPVSTLIVQTETLKLCKTYTVNFDLNYETTITTTTSLASTQLRHLSVGFNHANLPSLKDFLSDYRDTDDFIIGETRKDTTWEITEISWLTVTVRRSLDQSQLVRHLMGLAGAMCSETSNSEFWNFLKLQPF